MTCVLGISAFYHDSAAALVVDGRIVAAAQEERFSRIRHDRAFPESAIRFVLDHAGVGFQDLTSVSYYEDPAVKFKRVATTAIVAGLEARSTFAPILSSWISRKRRMDREVARKLREMGDRCNRIVDVWKHHQSHAASAFFPSPFDRAAVLCIDGVGEWETTTIWRGDSEGLHPIASLTFPHSLGMLYSAFTYFCGFKVDSGEYKLMGLAPYGVPVYADKILSELIDIKPDGSFRLDWTKFEFVKGEVMTGPAFEGLFDGPARQAEAPLTEREFNLAASVQKVTEIAVARLAASAARLTGERNLCMAGGVALNCVANGVISRDKIIDRVWIQPAAGDAGGALGAAILSDRKQRQVSTREAPDASADGMNGALLGPSYSDEIVEETLIAQGAVYRRLSEADLDACVVAAIANGAIVGWFQGRMEFGPRALGARSILGDPRRDDTQSTMNLRIKFRESFRPFAPAVLAEEANKLFDATEESPYMLLVSQVAQSIRRELTSEEKTLRGIARLKVRRSTLPAITHIDFSARVQTVDRERNLRFWKLLKRFDEVTGCPALVNTSFNVRGEPIVNTPREAYQCFMRTDIDALAIGSFYLEKSEQPEFVEDGNWRDSIPLD
jgi:carbamoyltransferase